MPPRRRQEREQPLARMRDEFEELFDRLMSRWQSPALPAESEETDLESDRVWALDVDDREDEIVVRAEVPGFEPGELDVQLCGRLLTIRAERQQENRDRDRGFEARVYQTFQRTIMLPGDVDPDNVQARYHSGVLEIHLPRTQESRPKRISAQA